MAPTKTGQSHSTTISVGGLSGGLIVALMVTIFIFVFWYQYTKAKKLNAKNGTPIRKGSIFFTSVLAALTFGIVLFCLDGCGSDSSGNTSNVNGGGGGQNVQSTPMMDMSGGGGGGFLPPPPMPSYQPNMDYTPINSAAQDGVQG